MKLTSELKYPAFLAIALLYFFCNNTFLPIGLLYTAMLTPLFFYWLVKNDQLPKMLTWSILFIIPIPFHLFLGVDAKTYIISTGLIVTAYVFFFTALEAIKQNSKELEKVFTIVLLTNIALVLLVWTALYFDFGNYIFWHYTRITHGVPVFPRLQLFAYEPSHYALLLSPVYLFFFIKIITGQAKFPFLIIIAMFIPISISLSFGVIGGLAIAIVLALLISFGKLPGITKNYLLYGMASIVLVGILALYFWPTNPIFIRVTNILTGNDTSSSGRIEWAFKIAVDMIDYKKAWMGVGPGQLKVLFTDLLTKYYNFEVNSPINYRIPNSIAEMLAIYGPYGVIVKIVLEIYFFIRLKIYDNLYTFALFIFIFIYQFTGSFTVNIAEIGIWALVFASGFTSLNFKSLKTQEL